MSYSSKRIKRDADQKPIPQYFNPNTDDYEALQGKNGAYNVNVLESALPAGAATDAKLDLILSKLEDVESELTAIKSTNGIKKIEDTVAVQLTGSLPTKPPAIETLVNAQSLAAGTTIEAVIDPQGAKRIILAVNSDKLWKLATNSFWANVPGAGGKDHTYPDCYTNAQPAATSGNYPKQVIIGMFAGKATDELMALRNQVIPANIKVAITNADTTTATIMVKVMRIWEVA
jgi:hypothetical protein